MAWVRIDDQFPHHPKVLAAGPLAGWVHVCAIAYCSQYLTDGLVPRAAVNGLADFSTIEVPPFRGHRGRATNHPEPMDVVPTLLAAGLWEETDAGFIVHDYLAYNPSREDVLGRRKYDQGRKRSTVTPDDFRAESNGKSTGIRPESENVPTGIRPESDSLPGTLRPDSLHVRAPARPGPGPGPVNVPGTELTPQPPLRRGRHGRRRNGVDATDDGAEEQLHRWPRGVQPGSEVSEELGQEETHHWPTGVQPGS